MFSRIANLFKGFLSLFISGLERQNPKALIEAEKENLRAADRAVQREPRQPRRASASGCCAR